MIEQLELADAFCLLPSLSYPLPSNTLINIKDNIMDVLPLKNILNQRQQIIEKINQLSKDKISYSLIDTFIIEYKILLNPYINNINQLKDLFEQSEWFSTVEDKKKITQIDFIQDYKLIEFVHGICKLYETKDLLERNEKSIHEKLPDCYKLLREAAGIFEWILSISDTFSEKENTSDIVIPFELRKKTLESHRIICLAIAQQFIIVKSMYEKESYPLNLLIKLHQGVYSLYKECEKIYNEEIKTTFLNNEEEVYTIQSNETFLGYIGLYTKLHTAQITYLYSKIEYNKSLYGSAICGIRLAAIQFNKRQSIGGEGLPPIKGKEFEKKIQLASFKCHEIIKNIENKWVRENSCIYFSVIPTSFSPVPIENKVIVNIIKYNKN